MCFSTRSLTICRTSPILPIKDDFVGADDKMRWSVKMRRHYYGQGAEDLEFLFARSSTLQEKIYGLNRAKYEVQYYDSCGYLAATRWIILTDRKKPVIRWPAYNDTKRFKSLIDFLKENKPSA